MKRVSVVLCVAVVVSCFLAVVESARVVNHVHISEGHTSNKEKSDECLVNTDCKTCTANPNCGWCPYFGECYLGTTDGPTDSNYTCPSDPYLGSWEKTVCCSETESCSECGQLPGCGWCDSTMWCYPGNSTGPSAADLTCKPDLEAGSWEFGSCCQDHYACDECTSDPMCGYCPYLGKCFRGSDSGPTAEGICPPSSLGTWQFAHCCITNYNCESCIATPGCGWCPSMPICVPGNSTGAYDDTCTASVTSGWEFDVCCTDKDDCASCTAAAGCGWCNAPEMEFCSPGTKAGPNQNITCTSDWDYGNNSCPTTNSNIPLLHKQ